MSEIARFTILAGRGGRVFVYRDVPAFGSLIASHSETGGGLDPFGNPFLDGDWCTDDYRLVPVIRAWPGMLLVEIGRPETPGPAAADGDEDQAPAPDPGSEVQP